MAAVTAEKPVAGNQKIQNPEQQKTGRQVNAAGIIRTRTGSGSRRWQAQAVGGGGRRTAGAATAETVRETNARERRNAGSRW